MEQMTIIFFFILMLSSAAEDKKSNFTRLQGGSVTFPHPVLKKGSLIFEDRIIVIVDEGKFRIWDKSYQDRVFWNNKTGSFTLRGLQRNNSGIYKIESEDREGVITYHELTVYEPVSAPKVKKLNVSTESCNLLCEVQKAEETTLYWYRDTEILSQSSLTHSLPLTLLNKNFTSLYRCVAENPAGNKTAHVNATTLCSKGDPKNPFNDDKSRYMIAVPIVITAAVVVVTLLALRCMYLKRKATQETQGSENRDSDVLYTDIHIPENRPRQERNQPGSPAADEGSSLTTVYDKIQAHRITPAETDACLYSLTINSPCE